MQAMVLEKQGDIGGSPLQLRDVPEPEPGAREVLVRIRCCACCRTDLHVIEGELPVLKSPVIPGHQVIGVIERTSARATRFRMGDRVGIPWLHQTDGKCEYCLTGRENLCRACSHGISRFSMMASRAR